MVQRHQFNSYLFVFSSHISVHFCSISYHTPSSAYITSLPIIPSFLSFPLMFQQILECISFTSFYVYDVYFSILPIKYVRGYKYMVVCWRWGKQEQTELPDYCSNVNWKWEWRTASNLCLQQLESDIQECCKKQTNKQTNKQTKTNKQKTSKSKLMFSAGAQWAVQRQ